MAVHIVCRAFVNWKRRSSVRGTPNKSTGWQTPKFKAFVKLWNETFNLSYFRCREQIYKIALENWKVVEDVDSISVRWRRFAERARPGDLILPTDDDDWFRPDIVQRIKRHLQDGTRIIGWNEIRLTATWDGLQCQLRGNANTERGARLYTNSYGFVMDADLKQNGWIKNHSFASWAANGRHRDKYRPIDDLLVANNKHLLSLTTINHKRSVKNGAELVGLVEKNAIEIELPPEAGWTELLVGKIQGLYRTVLGSRK